MKSYLFMINDTRARLVCAVKVTLAAVLFLTGANGLAAETEEESYMEEIIVTGAPRGVSKFDSTVSINTVGADEIALSGSRSAAEILRIIPGVRSESSAGEGNTNIAIRGAPIASGGSKFLQLQEDGMPILQFGDMPFATSDQFLRADNTLSRVEVLKGSKAATLASNSPSGVINFISKTGKEEGGSVGITTGLDYDSFRTDFDYGSPIGDGDWRFHFGGFYREGEGVREVDFNASRGGQFKANLTREFDNGHITFYAKVLNDRVPTYLPLPFNATSQDSVPGLDAATATNISNDLSTVVAGNGRRSSAEDGNHSKSTAFGVDFEVEVQDGLILNEKFRYAQNSGGFFGAFTADIGGTDNIEGVSAALAGTGADGLSYVSGANAGVELTAAELANLNGNGLLQNLRTFDVSLDDLDNFTSDLSLTKIFDNGFDVTVGYYKATQQIDKTWYLQTFLQDVSDNPRLLNASAGGVQLTQSGQLAYGAPDWGACCTRDESFEADINAFYIAGHIEASDALSIDASVRYDDGEGIGHYALGTVVAADVNGDGIIGDATNGQLAESHVEIVDIASINATRFKTDWSYASYSLAANYILNDSVALFGSASRGTRVNADRLGDGGYLTGDGTADAGSVENEQSAYELGVKYNGDVFSAFTTFFFVETDDTNSATKAGLPAGVARAREFESFGIDFEGVVQIGEIDIRGSLTWTDAEIVGANDTSVIGNTPRRQADLVWSLSPSYRFADSFLVGATIISTTDSFSQDDNTYEMDGYTYANLFVDYALTDNMNVQLTVNNVTDELGITEAEGGTSTVRGVDYVRARAIAGTSTALTLQYTF